MMEKHRFSFLAIIILITALPVMADPIYDASLLEKEGRRKEAAALYDEWLEGNRGDLRFPEILFYASSVYEKADDAISLLNKHSPYLDSDDLRICLVRIARLFELTFRYSKAADHYRKAAQISSGSPDPRLILKALMLEYQNGIIPDDEELDYLLMSQSEPQVYVDALIFKTEILKSRDEAEEAERILVRSRYSNLFPEIQYALWEIYGLQGKAEDQQRVKEFMEKTYPDSVELALLKGEAEKAVRLSDLFINQPGLPVSAAEKEDEGVFAYVQAGTFAEEKNAEALMEELASSGFNSFMEKSSDLIKVIVADRREAGIIIRDLRAAGFDGFRIDYQ